ncbi:MAG: FkbM family methyltransferase [Desulfuromonas sp.]
MSIIDIGANVGAASIFFSLKFPSAKVYGFEPLPDIWKHLDQNTKSFKNIQAFPFGLLSTDCNLNFYSGIRSSVESSIVPHVGTSDKPVIAHFKKASTILEKLNIRNISIYETTIRLDSVISIC